LPLIERTNEVWLQSLGGSGAADEAAVAELREVLRRGLRRALAGRAAADDGFIEDMAQEGVLKVLGGLATFRGDSRFTSWAITVAVRVAFTELRRARWRDVSLDRLVEDAPARLPTTPPADGPSQDARQTILAEMHRVLESGLTDRQRQALVAELRGMPQGEIAAQMGLTRNALYKLTHDAATTGWGTRRVTPNSSPPASPFRSRCGRRPNTSTCAPSVPRSSAPASRP
jgi:RNA polymerase sigma-70 factor (ECF subfamily)